MLASAAMTACERNTVTSKDTAAAAAAADAAAVDTLKEHMGDLLEPLARYATSSSMARTFWMTYRPSNGGVQSGKNFVPGYGHDRRCNQGQQCSVTSRALVGSTELELDKIRDNGTVVASFATRGSNQREDRYEWDSEALGYLLVVLPNKPRAANAAQWRMVGVFRENGNFRLEITPPLSEQSGKPFRLCEPGHSKHSYDLIGFSSCPEKASLFDPRPDSLGEQWLAERSASLSNRLVRSLTATQDLYPVWITCHLGCCRAEYF